MPNVRLATAVELVNVRDDASAFAEAVRPEMPVARRLAARLAPVGEADDVLQDALIRAWRHRRTYDPARGTVGAWLLAIVANEARRARRRRRISFFRTTVNEPEPVERRLDVEMAVSRLPPRQRLAVDCFYYVGLNVAETAAVMKCSEGTVKSTLSDARGRLKHELAGLRREP